MRLNSEWWKYSSDPDPEKNEILHGIYQYRLPQNAHGTAEKYGYSKWHLLAIQALSNRQTLDFLELASKERSDTLIDDITESMTCFDETWYKDWLQNAIYRSPKKLTWEKLRKLTWWKTPLQICALLERPLIRLPFPIDWKRYSPVILAAQTDSIKRLENIDN